jgi:hypothetical protein
MQKRHTIAVDLDGVLAKYDGWKGIFHIGDPIPYAVEWCNKLAEQYDVVINTSRCNPFAQGRPDNMSSAQLREIVIEWLNRHGFKYKDVYVGVGKLIASAYVDDRAVTCRPQDYPASNVTVNPDEWAKTEFDAVTSEIEYLCNYTATKEKDVDFSDAKNKERSQ